MAWLINWNRRKSKIVSGTTPQTNYQMKLIIHKGSGTDTSTDIYLGTNAIDDFSDVRFTSSDGSTLLNYWIESLTPGSVATIWTKIPSIPASPDTDTIYVYYNNPSPPPTGPGTGNDDGPATFPLLFDHFLGTSLDTGKWTATSCNNYTISGSILTVKQQTCANSDFEIFSNTAFGNFTAFRTKLSIPWGSCGGSWNYNCFGYATGGHWGSNNVIIAGSGNWTCNSLMNYTSGWGVAGISGDANTHIWEIQRTNSASYAFKDNTLAAGPLSAQYPTTTGDVGFQSQTSAASSIVVDWALVRTYVNPEPTFGTSSTEQYITAISMSLNSNSCLGPCSITATVTWQNLGGSSVTFRPAILVDGTTIFNASSDITIAAGGTGSSSITTTTLSIGSHSICPNPN